jgi:hypothetical protein
VVKRIYVQPNVPSISEAVKQLGLGLTVVKKSMALVVVSKSKVTVKLISILRHDSFWPKV